MGIKKVNSLFAPYLSLLTGKKSCHIQVHTFESCHPSYYHLCSLHSHDSCSTRWMQAFELILDKYLSLMCPVQGFYQKETI